MDAISKNADVNSLLSAAATAHSATDQLDLLGRIIAMTGSDSLVPLLPAMLRLEGQPYSLEHHPQFEPFFRSTMPKEQTWITGRQTAKTSSEAASSVALAAAVPRFRQLFVTPLFDQVRRLSSNYVKPLIAESPIQGLLVGSSSDKSVLQRSFLNKSMLQFTFALQDANRTRGFSTDFIRHDEVQHSNPALRFAIHEGISHSKYGLIQNAGTPLTPENILSALWQQSSMAEWFIPCLACKTWNIPSTEFHLNDMLGPYREDITENEPGLICYKCKRPINPANGFWNHRKPELRWDHAGYHVPQPIMWIHYSRADKWSELLAKREGRDNYTPDKFANEVLGEACGSGAQLVSIEELKDAASLPWRNNPIDPDKDMLRQLGSYAYRVLAVDWGGGGMKLDKNSGNQISLTTIAVLGWLPNGVVHVVWGRRLFTPHDHMREAAQVLDCYKKFRCHMVVHDYTGAGALRETFLVQNKIPVKKLIPVAYVRAASAAWMSFKAATTLHPRSYYQVDKTRSLAHVCAAIKVGKIRFFAYDWRSAHDAGLLHDFLGLVEEKVPTRGGSDAYTISRHALLSDDFAQAVNIGTCALWYTTKSFPKLVAERGGEMLTKEQVEELEGPENGWLDLPPEEQ